MICISCPKQFAESIGTLRDRLERLETEKKALKSELDQDFRLSLTYLSGQLATLMYLFYSNISNHIIDRKKYAHHLNVSINLLDDFRQTAT